MRTKSGIARFLGLFLRLKLGLNFSILGQSLRMAVSWEEKSDLPLEEIILTNLILPSTGKRIK